MPSARLEVPCGEVTFWTRYLDWRVWFLLASARLAQTRPSHVGKICCAKSVRRRVSCLCRRSLSRKQARVRAKLERSALKASAAAGGASTLNKVHCALQAMAQGLWRVGLHDEHRTQERRIRFNSTVTGRKSEAEIGPSRAGLFGKLQARYSG